MAKPERCPCLDAPIVADGDTSSSVKAPKAKKAIKRKSLKGAAANEGNHCVFSRKSGKLVRCYKTEDAAKRVARGFGPKFRLGPRKTINKGA